MDDRTHTPDTRAGTPFSWYVSCGMPAYAELAGVPYDRTFYDADAIIQAYTVGYPRAVALFGSEVRYSGPGWSGISYGHVNCLGSPLRFPEGSDVAHSPIHNTLDTGIRALQQPVEWASAGLMPDYLTLWQKLKDAFPDLPIRFAGFGVEGPVTTAWELRGHDFFTDIYDNPERLKDYLTLVTASVVDYMVFQRQVNGEPAFLDTTVGMVDDISALIHPRLWGEFVLPYHQAYFKSQTTGRRHAHIEGLVPKHLPYLDALKLDDFDPSVSPTLRPEDIRDGCSVPFWWRINAMHFRDYSLEKVRDFVYNAVAGGASGVFASVGRIMTSAEAAFKLKVFMHAAQHVEALLHQDIAPDQVAEHRLPIKQYG
ncbi:MAG: hypothetical protein E4H27_05870 [Anaerolineales bacterium]|nr:MAG: hypothetical protein E4H27_05870 [Anaerolineales bacterium]